jgi:hypothetical protein
VHVITFSFLAQRDLNQPEAVSIEEQLALTPSGQFLVLGGRIPDPATITTTTTPTTTFTTTTANDSTQELNESLTAKSSASTNSYNKPTTTTPNGQGVASNYDKDDTCSGKGQGGKQSKGSKKGSGNKGGKRGGKGEKTSIHEGMIVYDVSQSEWVFLVCYGVQFISVILFCFAGCP